MKHGPGALKISSLSRRGTKVIVNESFFGLSIYSNRDESHILWVNWVPVWSNKLYPLPISAGKWTLKVYIWEMGE